MPFLDNLDGWKLLVLLLVAVFVIGPERLPKALNDGVKMLRHLRDMARNATSDLSKELGTEITLEDLNPRALIRKHVLSEEDEQAIRRPLEDLYQKVDKDVRGINSDIRETSAALRTRPGGEATRAPAAVPARRFDADAT